MIYYMHLFKLLFSLDFLRGGKKEEKEKRKAVCYCFVLVISS